MSPANLQFGKYLGATRFERHLAGLQLTLTTYPSGFAHSWHTHANATVFVLLKGAHRDESRKSACLQPALTAAFHPTTEPHATRVGPGGMLGLNIGYSQDWLDLHCIGSRELGGWQLVGSSTTKLTALILLGSLFSWDPIASSSLETAAFEFIESIIPSNQAQVKDRPPTWFPRAQEYIHQSFREAITLRDVASEVDIHPVYFARVFRRQMGCSVGEYLRKIRLVEAGRLIVERERSLIQAAADSGFADQSHFTRCCSKVLGFAPGRLVALQRTGQAKS